jgi:hypothetical protein
VKNIKRALITATLLLWLAYAASQASANPGTPRTPAGVTLSGVGIALTEGVTWED